MIRRTIAVIFILLANIVLLAHAIVPHHHHQKQICIKTTHCRDDGIAHKHNTPEHKHEHDGNKDSSCCVLKQTLVLPSNNYKQACDFITYLESYSVIDFSLFNTSDEALIPSSYINASVADKFSLFSDYTATSLGLRGPPVA